MRHGRHPDPRHDLAPTAPALGRCLLVSLLVHGALVALWIAAPNPTAVQPLPHLQVTLLAPPAPPIAPVQAQVRAEPLAQAMPPASPAVRPGKLASPVTTHPKMPASPKRLPEAAVATSVAVAAPTPSPAVASAQSAALASSHMPTQAPAHALSEVPVPSPASRSDTMDVAALDAYAQSLSVLLARHRAYPATAAMRGWEGEVRLTLRIARRGALIDVQVQRSSGYEVLDRNAVQLVQQASPLPLPPEGLAGSEFQVSIPIQYRLRKNS